MTREDLLEMRRALLLCVDIIERDLGIKRTSEMRKQNVRINEDDSVAYGGDYDTDKQT